MEELRIVVEKNPDRKDIDVLTSGLDRYNIAKTGSDDAKVLAIFLKDHNGQIVGGIYGWSWAGWLEVKYLWIEEAWRGKGYGSKLLNLAEQEGIFRKCNSIFLDTFSFQAPEFYKKLGYKVFGVLKDYPGEHKRYFLKKKLIQSD
ncbi:MAG: hypothetical protein A2Z27_00875 [candidate division Zixibacteria bacterium RBG_16_50_21]|nr:MAG: hypothetical protein A2Z27_00875 [candidate division Zixibacteria bacterium RBG_16_50_21]